MTTRALRPPGRRTLARALHPFHMHPTNPPSVHTHCSHLQRTRSHPLHMHVPYVAPCVHHLGVFTCVVEGQAPPGTSKTCQEWLMTRGSSKQGAETVLLSVTCDRGSSAGKWNLSSPLNPSLRSAGQPLCGAQGLIPVESPCICSGRR